MIRRILLFLALVSASLSIVRSEEPDDFYSSISGMESLLGLEEDLLKVLEDYVHRELEKLQKIKTFLEDLENDALGLAKTSGSGEAQSVNKFKTVKRALVDFNDLVRAIFDRTHEEKFRVNFLKAGSGETDEPLRLMLSDLEGAAMGLSRLQDTYKLNATELSNSRVFGVQYGRPLNANDCIHIALILKNQGKNAHAFEWYEAAWQKYQNEGDRELIELMGEVKFLKLFSDAAFESGRIQKSIDILKDAEQRHPDDMTILPILRRYKKYKAHKESMFTRSIPKAEKPLTREELYKATCRGERHQTPTQERALRCMYSDNGVPYRKIGPFKLEQLNLEPPIVYYHEAIYDKEIEKVLQIAEPSITRSKVGDLSVSRVSTIRTSKNTWIDANHYSFMAGLKQRIIDMSRLDYETAEQLQVANYGIGGHYAAHYDFSANPLKAYSAKKGNRIATALFYISEVEAGGSTAFPLLKLNVKPIRRSMVFWYNLHNSTDPDYRTLHAGCPVIKGSKWILNQWLHEGGQLFTRPCGVHSTTYLSAEFSSIPV